ncbi:MAG: HEAT repeat domain-containing protein [Candidatus Bipolaricaulia bacterium]
MNRTALSGVFAAFVLLTGVVAVHAAQDQQISQLIEALQDAEPSVRWQAAITLGEIGPDARDAIPALIEALRDEDSRVRQAAAEVLETIQEELVNCNET